MNVSFRDDHFYGGDLFWVENTLANGTRAQFEGIHRIRDIRLWNASYHKIFGYCFTLDIRKQDEINLGELEGDFVFGFTKRLPEFQILIHEKYEDLYAADIQNSVIYSE